MHPGIKLRHIRAFAEIAASGSLSDVARRQGVTQPALSRSLAELEAMLGQALFLRQGRRLVLTDAGRLFLGHAETGLKALEAAASAVAPGGAGGRLKVGVLPTVAGGLFPAVALRFVALQPDVTLSVESGPHPYLVGRIRDGSIDLLVGRMPAGGEMAGLAFEHLYEEEIVVAVRAGHPLAGRPAEEALFRMPLIVPPEGAAIRRTVADYLASIGLALGRPAFETVSPAIGRGLLLGSDAVWFISRGVIGEALEKGEIVTLPARAGFLSGSVGITRPQGSDRSPGLDTLVELLRAAARDMAAGLRRQAQTGGPA